MATQLKNNEHNGRWVLRSFLGFFAVFCAVDMYFVYTAISTHTGVVAERSYYKGLDYNNTLAAARQQKDSGYQGTGEYQDGTLHFTLRDKDGAPVAGAHVKAALQIPTHDTYDFTITLPERSAGVYETDPLTLPARGNWRAQIEATWTQQQYKTSLNFVAQ